MSFCVIRTSGGLAVCMDAGAVEPWFDIAAVPDSSAGTFGLALNRIVFALRVLRPIQCKAITNQPFTEIDAAYRTGRDGAPVSVETQRDAIYRALSNEGVELVCCPRATAILRTVLAAAKLAAFRGIDTPKADTSSMNLQRIAVNDAGLANKIVGYSR